MDIVIGLSVIGIGYLAFKLCCDQKDHVPPLSWNEIQQRNVERLDPTDHVIIAPYPTVRRGIYYSNEYMLNKQQRNTPVYPSTSKNIHNIEASDFRKRNILALRN